MKKPATTIRTMQTPGGTNQFLCAARQRLGGVGVLQHHAPHSWSGSPKPRKLTLASVRIAQPIAIAA